MLIFILNSHFFFFQHISLKLNTFPDFSLFRLFSLSNLIYFSSKKNLSIFKISQLILRHLRPQQIIYGEECHQLGCYWPLTTRSSATQTHSLVGYSDFAFHVCCPNRLLCSIRSLAPSLILFTAFPISNFSKKKKEKKFVRS